MNGSEGILLLLAFAIATAIVTAVLLLVWAMKRLAPSIFRLLRISHDLWEGTISTLEAWAARKRMEAESKSLRAFPVEVQALQDGPGMYRVSGVVRQTEEEADWHIEARTRANAQVKAELRGMVVTSVERVATSSGGAAA